MYVNVLQFLNNPDITATATVSHRSHKSDSATYVNQDTRYTYTTNTIYKFYPW